MTANGFAPVSDLIKDIANGRMVILVDDESRESEGDVILAADHDCQVDQLHGASLPRSDLLDSDTRTLR